jgi:hypothetical protein
MTIDIPTTTDTITITCRATSLSVTWSPPVVRPVAPGLECWAHRSRETIDYTLAGRPGQVTCDTFITPDLLLTREIWVSAEDGSVALRHRVENRQSRAIQLDALLPLDIAGPDGLLIDGAGAAEWQVLAQSRLKNGIPTAFRPGQADGDRAHVKTVVGELGDIGESTEDPAQIVEMDPFTLINLRDRDAGPSLLIGFISQTGHCARLLLGLDGESTDASLVRLTADCEFDGSEIPPGGERTSQWVLVHTGDNPNALVADFAERVADLHGVNPPARNAPSVHCTWQYYGPHFTERDLADDLAYLEGDRIPFDVFLIDDCWSRPWGDWVPNDDWLMGMKAAADRVSWLGYRPGLWTCPFLAKATSELASRHPEWLLRLEDGSLHTFKMDGLNYVLDPTYPGVCEHLQETYRRITFDWGFTYHKFDFMRSVTVDRRVRFHDPTATRLAAYRLGLEAIRKGAGPDAYLAVCGGHYGGSLGLAESQRSGSDVAACWDEPPAVPKFKQNLMRTWMSRLWHVDPDAMMVRRREEPINQTRHGSLSLGKFTDDEARTVALNQYLGGGLVCISEKFSELDSDRKDLYRHVVPSVNGPSVPLDPLEPHCPSVLVTRVSPQCAELGPWVTVAIVNWTDDSRNSSIDLSPDIVGHLEAERFLVFEFLSQRILGIFHPGDVVALDTVPPHASRLLRIAPWTGVTPVLAGTDLHFSGGGVEIAEWATCGDHARGRIQTRWPGEVRMTIATPSDDGWVTTIATASPDAPSFSTDNH